MSAAKMVGGLRGQTFGAVCTIALVYQSVRFGAISMKQIDFSTAAVLPEPLRSPPPLFKMPTLHGDHATRNVHPIAEVDALTTRNRPQAFLSTPSPRTGRTHTDQDHSGAALAAKKSHFLIHAQNRFTNPDLPPLMPPLRDQRRKPHPPCDRSGRPDAHLIDALSHSCARP